MADGNQQEFPTILGPDASFKGELSFDKGMRLMGRFEGKINTPGRLQIAKEAKMQADVDAGAIIVEGDVQGNLSASDRIELKQSARYEGDLKAAKLVVDEGAVFNGHVSVGPDVTKGTGRPTPPQQQNINRPNPQHPAGQPQPAKA
ncbi:MAG TPA: polymer-forming cytoskeletal protein [Humisphaera sp.]|jgi:cytoskeletal protein CcmA (bactofilin family)|nr:polymer-forming cytoskeletal protein [Humisphaera sp.]